MKDEDFLKVIADPKVIYLRKGAKILKLGVIINMHLKVYLK